MPRSHVQCPVRRFQVYRPTHCHRSCGAGTERGQSRGGSRARRRANVSRRRCGLEAQIELLTGQSEDKCQIFVSRGQREVDNAKPVVDMNFGAGDRFDDPSGRHRRGVVAGESERGFS